MSEATAEEDTTMAPPPIKAVPMKAVRKRVAAKAGPAPTDGPPTAVDAAHDVLALQAEIERLKAEVERVETTWTTKWENSWYEMGRRADARGLCSEYDEVVRDIGGIPRNPQVGLVIKLTCRTKLDDARLRNALGTGPYLAITPTSDAPEVEWCTEVAVNERARVRPGECACGSYDATTYARSWMRDQGLTRGRATTLVSAEAIRCDGSGNRCRNRT